MSTRNPSNTPCGTTRKSEKQLRREALRAEREAKERALSERIDSSANYLVFYDGHIIASFESADDALLFEGELADLDRDHATRSVECRVFDRRGHRIGGYTITAGMLMTTVEDRDYERKYSNKRLR